MTKEKRKFPYLTSSYVLIAYGILLDKGIVSFGIPEGAREKVDSLTGVINNRYFGVHRYPTEELRAAAYFYFIIKNHPFTDGNKRTAVLVLKTYCELNGLSLRLPIHELDALAVYIEGNKVEDHYAFIHLTAEVLFTDIISKTKSP